MARPKNEDNSLPPDYLNLQPFAVAEWVRMVKNLQKKKLFQDSDRVLLEFYIVNYQNFVLGTKALASLENEQKRVEEMPAANMEEVKAQASILKSIRMAKRTEQDNVNTAISRGTILSQKLFLNPNDRRKGKLPEEGEGKDAFGAFLKD